MRNHDAQRRWLVAQAAYQAGDLEENRRQRGEPDQPAGQEASPVGLGRGVCSTSTAGMIDNGDSATTSASGMSSVSTDPQLPDIGGPFRRTIIEERIKPESYPHYLATQRPVCPRTCYRAGHTRVP